MFRQACLRLCEPVTLASLFPSPTVAVTGLKLKFGCAGSTRDASQLQGLGVVFICSEKTQLRQCRVQWVIMHFRLDLWLFWFSEWPG